MGNKVYILNYLRKGLINNVTSEDAVSPGTSRAHIDMNLKFQVKDAGTGRTHDLVLPGQRIELLGPADVKGVNSRAICRVSPAQSGDVRLNASYRPYMEFYEEDLPWRYTPFAPGSSSFLPWMRLVAVKVDECVISFKGGVKIARINLTQERINEVFCATDQHARSAHVQIDVDDNFNGNLDEETVNQLLDENPDCGISRVLCMSKLEPATQYILLLIPTYEQGRLSALGMSLDGVNMDALVAPQPGIDLELPIYYKWKCMTATHDGTFKVLADKLNFTPADDYKKMEANLTVDISHSGLKTVSFDQEKKIDVPAALVMNDNPYSHIDDEGQNYRNELLKHLSLSPVLDENELEDVNQEQDPWVVPPVYGARHLMTTRTDLEKGPDATLVGEVNLKLHNRIVAGMGGTVVMDNQEEFVNRAWKKVEVVNALNQLLREYYQMNQVNNRAMGMNARSSINKAVLNKQNEGLISDAALRMLQTSGIYYNNVAPDTLLEQYNGMKEKDSGEVYAGISKDYLARLYDPDMWKGVIDADNKHDYLSGLFINDQAWGEDGMADVDFLRGLFRTAMVDGKARLLPRDGAEEKLEATPRSLMMSEDWENIRAILSDDSSELDMTRAYNALKGLADRYETFNEMRITGFTAIGTNKNHATQAQMRPYPIHVNNPYGHTCIVPDSCFSGLVVGGVKVGLRPLAVEYLARESDKSPSYFFIVPKSCLDTLSPAYYLRIDEVLCPVECNGGKYSLGDDKNSYAAIVLQACAPQHSTIYKQLAANLEWMKDRNLYLTLENPKKGKKYELKETEPHFQRKIYNDNCQTSIKDTRDFKYKWLKWSHGGISDQFFFYQCDAKGKCVQWDLDITIYRKVLNEVLDNLRALESLMLQPTDVNISLYENDPRCVIISPQVLFKALQEQLEKDQDMSFADNKELTQIHEEVKKQNAIIQSELNIKPQPAPAPSAQAAVIDVVDPGQLARDRIKELAERYGVTEYNQLEGRLHDKYPVMIHPDYLDPTYFYLRELSIDYVLPASGNLARNSISCFYSNQAFEEAFLLGMNTEMGRELMWREYPTDQRGSYFRKFWDQAELPGKEELKTRYYDIEDIDKWKGRLGQNHKAGKGTMLVLAIKGELMQTFPDTDIFLQRLGAPGKKGTGDQIIKKDMASWLTPDTYLVGFNGIKKEDLKNYMLVFQQKPLSLQFSEQAEGQNNPWGIVNPQCYIMRAV